MTKHAKAGVTWSPDLGSSLVKDAHSLIPYSIFSEQRFYLKSFFFPPRTEPVVRPHITLLVLGSIEVLLLINSLEPHDSESKLAHISALLKVLEAL